jgi:hypothetical protein
MVLEDRVEAVSVFFGEEDIVGLEFRDSFRERPVE